MEYETGGECSTHDRDKKYNISLGTSEGNNSLGKLRCRWEDNIKIYLK